jgi:hypothetical protein
MDPLGQVLDSLVATAEGRVDVDFWQTFFKRKDGSGGPWVQGWINVLFPYLRHDRKHVRNDRMADWKQAFGERLEGATAMREIPHGLSRAPFVWRYLGQSFPMEFLGGFVGVAQDTETHAVRPAIGWAIREAPDSAESAHSDESLAQELHAPCPRSEARLVAGLITDPMLLTGEEAATLCERVEEAGRTSGIRLACVLAGDIEHIARFPEFSAPFRLVIGVPVKDLSESPARKRDIADLRDALERASEVPEAIWRAISERLPTELSSHPGLYLAISGVQLRATLHFGERRRTTQVTEVRTSGAAAVEVDISPGAHDARLQRILDKGASEEHASYLIEIVLEGSG